MMAENNIKKVKIKGIEYEIKKLSFGEVLDAKKDGKDLTNAINFIAECLVSPKLTIEDIAKLDMGIGYKLLDAVNKQNSVGEDFQEGQ